MQSVFKDKIWSNAPCPYKNYGQMKMWSTESMFKRKCDQVYAHPKNTVLTQWEDENKYYSCNKPRQMQC